MIACADVADLDRVASPFFAAMGLSHIDAEAEVIHHRREDEQKSLSEKAESNLRNAWAAEFAFYDRFRSLADDLNSAWGYVHGRDDPKSGSRV